MKLKRQSFVSQGSITRLLQMAGAAWGQADFKQTFELLERAHRLDPANPTVLLHLGRSHALRYRSADAARYFERAVRLAPNKAEILATAGRLFADLGNPQMAERYYRQALEQKDVPPDTVARVAELSERLHRRDDAAALVERALQLDNACPLARLTRARLHRQAGQLAGRAAVVCPCRAASGK